MQYPMPCPRCRRMVDARVRICVHCGADTDAMLRTPRALVPFILIGFLVLLGAPASARPIAAGAVVGLVVALAVRAKFKK